MIQQLYVEVPAMTDSSAQNINLMVLLTQMIKQLYVEVPAMMIQVHNINLKVLLTQMIPAAVC
jgi:hypothetical protein